MTEKILCVDDDASSLAAYQRKLYKQYRIETALGGKQGLDAIARGGPYAVVIADMRMPGMDGIEFIARVREIAPDTVRMMLTGDYDKDTAIEAINAGNIFRFLTKPCSPENLARALDAGIQQYRLVIAERELLEKTLSGSIRVLTEILALVDPQSFSHGQKLRELARVVAETLRLENPWELEMAAMLSQLGFVTIPRSVTLKSRSGKELSDMEREMLDSLPEVSSNLLANIPRLETVARIVLYQDKRFDGGGFPPDDLSGERLPVASRIIKVLSDLIQIESTGVPRPRAFESLRERAGTYDPRILDATQSCFIAPPEAAAGTGGPPVEGTRSVLLKDLVAGSLLASDVITSDGVLLVAAGNRVSPTLLERLKNFARLTGIQEPILVEGGAAASPLAPAWTKEELAC